MCGLVGFVQKEPNEKLLIELVNSITHRGPDDSGYTIINLGSSYLHLGSSRLSINGLNDGKMPMETDQGVIVYNGELFDIKKIKGYLRNEIKSTNDTIHLLSLLDQENVSCINNLNGMFAFAYYNKKSNELILSRDKLGIKPLYFGSNENFPIYFSSEIKPLIKNSLVANETSLDNIYETLAFGGIPKPSGFIEGINSLERNSYVVFKNSSISIFQNESNLKNNVYQKFQKNNFNEIFSEVIEDHLSADVDVNILLSGGIDSSLLCYFASEYFRRKVKVFTLVFDNRYFSEENKSDVLSRDLNIEQIKFQYPANKNNEIIEELFDILPEPILDPSIIPSYFLSKSVSKYTKAVISGDGADELFGGYEWYRALKAKELLRLFGIKNSFFKSLNIYSTNKISLSTKLDRFSKIYHQNLGVQLLMWQNSSSFMEDYLNDKLYMSYLKKQGLESNNINDIRYIDLDIFLYTNILKKSDTASMLNGLEIRPPFLDDRLIEYALSLNFQNQFTVRKTKVNLRSTLNDFNSTLSKYPKHGFSHDFQNWSLEVGLPYLKTYQNDFEILNNLKNVEDAYFNTHSGIRDIWKLYSIFKWIEVNGTNVK